MFEIIFTVRAKKALLKYGRSGSFPKKKFRRVMNLLRAGNALPQSLQDHQLKGNLSDFREFHLASDILVRYERDEAVFLITISKIGTHAELFGE